MKSEIEAGQIKSVQWFRDRSSSNGDSGHRVAITRLAAGAAIGLLLLAMHHKVLAITVFTVALLVCVLGIAYGGFQKSIDVALSRFGAAVGTLVGTPLLAITYLCLITPLRVFRRILGADDLHLRDRSQQSYWVECDTDKRKVRYANGMFATEAPVKGGHPLIATICAIAVLLILSEGVLRAKGYGRPVCYVADPLIGYYPQPNYSGRRSGGLVSTNKYGMRSANFDDKKPQGVFRILLLGDSTLYGGSYIDQSDLYSSRLQNKMNGLGLRGKVEVLAMGVNGWGPFHEHGFVSKFGTFNADLVIINLPIDDINRPLYGLMSVPFNSVQDPPHLALEEVVNHYMWEYRSQHAGLDEKWEAQQSRLGVREYGSLVDDLQARGAEVLVACLPGRNAGMGGSKTKQERLWCDHLGQTLARRGVRMYFPVGVFANKGVPNEIYYDMVHLQTKGHHLYADFLKSRIEADSQRFRSFESTELK